MMPDLLSNTCQISQHVVQGRLHGIVTCEHHKMQGLKQEAIGWNSELRRNIALCNDLVPLARNTLAGKLEERKAFLDVEAIFLVTSFICSLVDMQTDVKEHSLAY